MNNKSATDHNSNSMIAQLRAIRDKISLEIKDMNKEQMKAYFIKKKASSSEGIRKRGSK